MIHYIQTNIIGFCTLAGWACIVGLLALWVRHDMKRHAVARMRHLLETGEDLDEEPFDRVMRHLQEAKAKR